MEGKDLAARQSEFDALNANFESKNIELSEVIAGLKTKIKKLGPFDEPPKEDQGKTADPPNKVETHLEIYANNLRRYQWNLERLQEIMVNVHRFI